MARATWLRASSPAPGPRVKTPSSSIRSPSTNCWAANCWERNSRRLIGKAHFRSSDGEPDDELRLHLRSLVVRARRLKTRSLPKGSIKGGRNKPDGRPSMNREMCASLRPKGPVRKVPTSYDCSAESLGFNGGQHRHGGRTQPTRGRSSSHHDVTCNFADS